MKPAEDELGGRIGRGDLSIWSLDPEIYMKFHMKNQKGAMCCRWHCQLSTNSRILRRDRYVMTDLCEKCHIARL